MKLNPEKIKSLSLDQGWNISLEQADRLAGYTEILFLWAGKMNLIGPSAKARFWEEHLAPCLWLSQMLHSQEPSADLGSGAGLPGLVTACLDPNREMHLFEARRKRVSFLQTAAARLGLNRVAVHWQRVGEQDSTLTTGKTFTQLTARAVAEPEGLLAPAEKLLKTNGRLLVLTGPQAAKNLTKAAETSPTWSLENLSKRDFFGRQACILEMKKRD